MSSLMTCKNPFNDLLEVSRITRGKMDLRKEPVVLAAVISQAVETSQPWIESAGHTLHVSLPPEPVCLDADPVRLAQVFANLLNNAAKYTEPGGHIRLTAERQENEVVVSVRDTGIGIPATMLPRVFDLFAQVDASAGRTQGGLGIGLALVRGLVELHGGRIEVRSEGFGWGSEFIVRLPLVAHVAAAAPRSDRAASPELPPRRLLVVDDHPDVADSLALLLEALGAEVRVVYDGPSALEIMETFQPDAVLLDLGLPGMDGYEIALTLRRQPRFRTLPLIALTGWGQDEDRRRTQAAGFDHHLVKPPDIEVLKAVLDRVPPLSTQH